MKTRHDVAHERGHELSKRAFVSEYRQPVLDNGLPWLSGHMTLKPAGHRYLSIDSIMREPARIAVLIFSKTFQSHDHQTPCLSCPASVRRSF
jgi:hypothetical protein